ncbi:hypothetical protein FRC09_011017 [Ceratobasidium sp. 395]|nr:hypothetical protein FRC09_011017 [Ceratobasidium sp. 395]
MSLGLSLTAALTAVLFKEWLVAYVSDRPTQLKKRALQQQRRRDSLDRRMVPAMVSLLLCSCTPRSLYSLPGLSFSYGYSASSLLSLTIFSVDILIYHLGTTVVAVTYPNCPYQTPVATYLRPLFNEFGWVRGGYDDNLTRDTAVLVATAIPGKAHAVILANSGAHTLALTRLEDMLRRVSNATSIYQFYRFALDIHPEKAVNVRLHCTFPDKRVSSRVLGARALTVAPRAGPVDYLAGRPTSSSSGLSTIGSKVTIDASLRSAYCRAWSRFITVYDLRTQYRLVQLGVDAWVVPLDLQKRVADAFVVRSLPRLFDSEWDGAIAEHRSDFFLPLLLAAQAVCSAPVYKELIQDMRWNVALTAPKFKAVAFPCSTRFMETLNDLTPLRNAESYGLELLRRLVPQGLFALSWLGTINREALLPSLFPRTVIPILISNVKEQLSVGQNNSRARDRPQTRPGHKFEFKSDMIRAMTGVAVQLSPAIDKRDSAARTMVKKLIQASILGVLSPHFDNLA